MPVGVSHALVDLGRAFATLRRRWYVFGAQAVAAAGVPRFTADIDVTVEALPRELDVLVDALGQRHIRPRDVGDLRIFVAETRVLPVVHQPSNFPVDVVLAGPGLEEEMLSRVQLRKVGRTQIPFVDTPDLVVLKVLAGRPKDLEDVRALLRVTPAAFDISVARERVARVGALLEDVSLAATLDALVAETREKAAAKRRPAQRGRKSKATKRK